MTLLNSSSNTIWRFNRYYKTQIKAQHQVVLQENFTPLVRLQLDEHVVFLKREDESVVGSHKFRPLSYQAAYLLQNGFRQATLSSSGNAAIAMSQISANYPLKSIIFISPNTPDGKKDAINTKNSIVIETVHAPRFSNYLAKKLNIPQLRPSKDDNAIEGYKSLGFELFEQNPNVDAVFFCVTSGASLIGVYEAWQQILQESSGSKDVKIPALHCVFGPGHFAPHRLNKLKTIIASTGGAIWELSKEEMNIAEKTLDGQNIKTSIEGIKAFAASQKARKKHHYQAPVIILSGMKREAGNSKNHSQQFQQIANLQQLDDLIKEINRAK